MEITLNSFANDVVPNCSAIFTEVTMPLFSKSNNTLPIIAVASFLVVVVCLVDLWWEVWLELNQFLDDS